jgi:hypothetical protein
VALLPLARFLGCANHGFAGRGAGPQTSSRIVGMDLALDRVI